MSARKRRQRHVEPAAVESPSGRVGDARLSVAAAVIVACAAVVPYLVALSGDFVYDDRRQIVGNPLIQDPARLGEALLSDVWAFTGDREAAWSNYWRPLFVGWLALLYRLFGLASTVGWHAASIVLHVGVSLAVLALARGLGLGAGGAFAVSLLCAVHPSRAETVAWISGSPDALAALLLLPALALAAWAAGREGRGARAAWTGALVLGAAALLAKEVAVALPLVVAALVFARSPEPVRDRWRRAARFAALFAVPVVLFLLARRQVLGAVELERGWRQGPDVDLASAPRLLLFYLRHFVWPNPVAVAYPVRPLSADSGADAILGPLAVLVVIVGATVALARREPSPRVAPFGALLALATLAPALHVSAFPPERVVHDRYLYLPFVGLALVAVGLARAALARSRLAHRAEIALAAGALLAAVPLGLGAADASRAWRSELALWEGGVRADPTSAHAHLQLGLARRDAGDLAGARRALDRAAELAPTTQVLMARAELSPPDGRGQSAIEDLSRLHAALPDDPTIAERLALALVRAGDAARAESVLRTARERAPWRRCSLTSNLATILAATGRATEARDELDSVRSLVAREATLVCRRTLAQLADLERAAGRPEAARAALEQLLRDTAGLGDAETLALRERASAALARLAG